MLKRLGKIVRGRDLPIFLALIVFAAIVAGTGMTISQLAKTRILQVEAVELGQRWIADLKRHVPNFRQRVLNSDLAGIGQEEPFKAHLYTDILRYRFFDREGRLQIDSHEEIAPSEPDFETDLWPSDLGAVRDGEFIVRSTRSQHLSGEQVLTTIYLPVYANRVLLGVVGLDFDQSELYQRLHHSLWTVALVTGILTLLAAGIPGLLLVRRLRQGRELDAKIDYLTAYDARTGLPNENQLNECIARLSGQISRDDGYLGVVSMDVDRFRRITDTFGQKAAVQMLVEVTQRCQAAIRSSDHLYHIGGDAFVLVFDHIQSEDDLKKRVLQLRSQLSGATVIDGHHVPISVTMGVACNHSGEADLALLVRQANIALTRARAEGRNSVSVFEEGMDEKLHDGIRLEIELRHALEQDHLEVHYQPQVDMTSGELVGCEALVRWRHDQLGQISPGRFIPIAEESGLIHELGEWVLRRACAQAARWPMPLPVAVNFSPKQVRDGAIDVLIPAVLAETGLPPQRLEVEITEGLLMDNTEATVKTMENLRALGVRIAMDDFGTGFSSLSYLSKFSFDKIKIDCSFVQGLYRTSRSDDHALAIVRTILHLGQALQTDVIAEGVETQEQVELLLGEGCRFAQGFLFSKPLTNRYVHALLSQAKPVIGKQSAA